MVLREGAAMALTGTVCGTVVAFLGAQAVSTMLFGISPRDPGTYLFVPAVLLAVTIAACWVPAWRATRIDPAVALRDE
jgi:ABC-type antimicrobial peptide transport system permease subunit